MEINFKTPVNGHYLEVFNAFDRDLFEALKPPYGEMNIVSFSGSRKGDKVHLRFLRPFKAEWISEIIEDKVTEKKAYFVDIGTTIPWPLLTWKHEHVVEKVDDHHSLVIDHITFTGKNSLLTLLLYPVLYLGFYPRKKIYRRYFKNRFHNQMETRER